MAKRTKLFIPIYLLFIVAVFLYVRAVLNEIPLDTKGEEKKVEKIYPITVSLRFSNGNATKTYPAVFNNIDTLTDLMETLRDHQGLIFEKTDYFKKTTIDSVTGIIPPTGYRWGLFLGTTDYTNNMGSTRLVDKAVYDLKLVKE